jgi:hypothetical protein
MLQNLLYPHCFDADPDPDLAQNPGSGSTTLIVLRAISDSFIPVVVLKSGHNNLLALPAAGLQLEQWRRRGIPPLRQKHGEGQRLRGVLQQTLEVAHHPVHQLLAEGRIGLEGAAMGLEVEDGTAGPEVGINVGEGGAVLTEVAVEGAGKAFHRHLHVKEIFRYANSQNTR